MPVWPDRVQLPTLPSTRILRACIWPIFVFSQYSRMSRGLCWWLLHMFIWYMQWTGPLRGSDPKPSPCQFWTRSSCGLQGSNDLWSEVLPHHKPYFSNTVYLLPDIRNSGPEKSGKRMCHRVWKLWSFTCGLEWKTCKYWEYVLPMFGQLYRKISSVLPWLCMQRKPGPCQVQVRTTRVSPATTYGVLWV